MNWKNKLENIHELPGETVTDKNAAWEKLHSRLRHQPRPARILWYWAAAASFLFIITIAVVIPGKKQGHFLKKNTVSAKAFKRTLHEVPLSEDNKATVTSSLMEQKQITEQSVTINQNKIIPEKDIKNQQPVLNGPHRPNNTVQQAAVLSAGTDSSRLLNITATVPVKKRLKVVYLNELNNYVEETPGITMAPVKEKLRIVHINELNGPSGEISVLAHSYAHHSFEFKLISQDVYTSPSLSSNYAGLTILKSRNLPSN